MLHHKVEHNTEAWDKLRLGKITSSEWSSMFANKSTAEYRNLIFDTAFERVFARKEIEENHTNMWMERGHIEEDMAVEAYEIETLRKTQSGGFFELNSYIGSSPDRLVGNNGLLEIKCPRAKIHKKYLKSGKIPSIYLPQCTSQLYISGRDWLDFVSYHPDMKISIVRLTLDDRTRSEYDLKIMQVIEEIKQEEFELNIYKNEN